MKLKLTTTAKKELKVINVRIMEDDSAYDKLTEHEILLTDAELYVEGAYEDNEFDNLEEWCSNVGQSEYDPKYLKKHPNVVIEKINKMINKDLLVVAE